MPKGQWADWMVTTNDPDWKLQVNENILAFCEQPEQPPGIGWHRQVYVELAEPAGGKQVSRMLDQPVREKESKANASKTEAIVKKMLAGEEVPDEASSKKYFYKNIPRNGAQSHAIAYCSSTWYCHRCHEGDHEGFTQSYDWGYTFNPEDHAQCLRKDKHGNDTKELALKEKGKVGPTTFDGKFRLGRGKTSKGSGGMTSKIIADIRDGKDRRFLYETYGAWAARYHSYIDKTYGLFAPHKNFMPAIFWLWGKTGTFKSRLAGMVCPEDTYFKPDSEKWFYTYDRHGIVVLNDYDKQSFTWQYVKNLFDRGPFEVQNKGGQCAMVAKMFIVTCSMPHEQCWAEKRGEKNDDLDQLTRRLAGRQFCLNDMTLAQKDDLLHKMREVYTQVKYEPDPLFSAWDGKGPIPPRRHFDEPPVKKLRMTFSEKPDYAPEDGFSWKHSLIDGKPQWHQVPVLNVDEMFACNQILMTKSEEDGDATWYI